MKIEIYQGCTANDIVIDGKSVSDMTSSEQDIIVEELLQKAKEAIMRNEVQMIDLIEMFQYDDYNVGSTCDQCNDNVTTTIYNL